MSKKKILIVGAGFYGATCAWELTGAGHDVTVIDKRNHVAGNAYTRWNADAGCNEHVYGAHIFHTNSEMIWKFVNKFITFNNYVNRVKVNYENSLYSFPINLMTMYQVFGCMTPTEASERLKAETANYRNGEPANLEEHCLAQLGPTLYELFIKGYTQKQWRKDPRELPASLIKRLPVRLNFDDNYFFDKYQGIPIGGYTTMVERMLEGSKVLTAVAWSPQFRYQYDFIIYTGAIDAFFDYEYGELPYRSLRFESKLVNLADFQGNAVVNYTDAMVPHTRILEHKHFDMNYTKTQTLLTFEYPADWKRGETEYYPIESPESRALYNRYRAKADALDNVHIGGRLGEYRYYDMHQVIASALTFCNKFLAQKENSNGYS